MAQLRCSSLEKPFFCPLAPPSLHIHSPLQSSPRWAILYYTYLSRKDVQQNDGKGKRVLCLLCPTRQPPVMWLLRSRGFNFMQFPFEPPHVAVATVMDSTGLHTHP